VRRIFLIAVATGAVWCGHADAATTLVPGVRYSRQVQFTVHGPVVFHVLTAPRPVGLYALKPVLSNELITGRETVTSMQRRLLPTTNVVGVNGDFFHWELGFPSGLLMRSGVLDHPPVARRSSVGVDAAGTLQVGRVAFFGSWRGAASAHPFQSVNQPPRAGETVLFTPAWGATTPAEEGTVEATLLPFPPTAPGVPLTGTVAGVRSGGGTPIPAGGAVLVSRGPAAPALAAEAPIGSQLTVRLTLRPAWPGLVDALGGGPELVRRGQPVYRALEDFTPSQVIGRDPRTAVGQRADGSLVVVAVDGRRSGYSIGITNFDLAQMLVRLGAVTGSALDSGGSTTIAFNGKLLNRPSDPGGERPVAEMLALTYAGVYATEVPAVLSPNGDGVAETEPLSYKLVRPSTVDARLVGPDGLPRQLDAAARAPGTYAFPWNGLGVDGAPALEGTWRWVVTATDDLGRQSAMTRTFALNRTLGFFALRAQGGRRLRASFVLARPAFVTVRVVRWSGVVKTLARRPFAAGAAAVSWNGLRADGKRARPGAYTVRIVATNELGRVELVRPLVVR
jgi:hypothetical protein